MEKNDDMLLATIDNDLALVETMLGLSVYKKELKNTFQTNYLELVEKKTNKIFFKLHILNENRWEFFDYGWMNYGNFHAYKTKILIFDIPDIVYKMVRHEDSNNHVMILNNGISYLLFSPYSKIIDIMFQIIIS